MSNEVAEAIEHLASVLARVGEGTTDRPGVIEDLSTSIKDGFQVLAEATQSIANALESPPDYTDAIQAVADALESVADAIKDKK